MILKEQIGDVVASECRRCNKAVKSHRQRRAVNLARTRLVVQDVLVDVCPECGHMISITPESYDQVREAGAWK